MNTKFHLISRPNMHCHGYSLWLMPEGKTYIQIAKLIQNLSESEKTSCFEPHVTLIGEIKERDNKKMVRKAQRLASGQRPFFIQLDGLGYLSLYLRALFIKAKKTKDLLDFYGRAKKIFKLENTPTFMPHLSLLYGDFSSDSKEKIMHSIKNVYPKKIFIDRLYLLKTEGTVDDWNIIASFPFGSK